MGASFYDLVAGLGEDNRSPEDVPAPTVWHGVDPAWAQAMPVPRERSAVRAADRGIPLSMDGLYEQGLELPWIEADGPEQAEAIIDLTIQRVREQTPELEVRSVPFIAEAWRLLLEMGNA